MTEITLEEIARQVRGHEPPRTLLFYFEEDSDSYQGKVEYLETLGLVKSERAGTKAPDLVKFGMDPKSMKEHLESGGDMTYRHDVLVYEDERAEFYNKKEDKTDNGAWRVHAKHFAGKSIFQFRFWDQGLPAKLGEDTMSGAAIAFAKRYDDYTALKDILVEYSICELKNMAAKSKYKIKQYDY